MNNIENSEAPQTDVMDIVLDPNTAIKYPAEDLKDLKKCMKHTGFFTQCYKATGVSNPTINSYAKGNMGLKGKIDAVVAFVNVFLIQVNKKRA